MSFFFVGEFGSTNTNTAGAKRLQITLSRRQKDSKQTPMNLVFIFRRTFLLFHFAATLSQSTAITYGLCQNSSYHPLAVRESKPETLYHIHTSKSIIYPSGGCIENVVDPESTTALSARYYCNADGTVVSFQEFNATGCDRGWLMDSGNGTVPFIHRSTTFSCHCDSENTYASMQLFNNETSCRGPGRGASETHTAASYTLVSQLSSTCHGFWHGTSHPTTAPSASPTRTPAPTTLKPTEAPIIASLLPTALTTQEPTAKPSPFPSTLRKSPS